MSSPSLRVDVSIWPSSPAEPPPADPASLVELARTAEKAGLLSVSVPVRENAAPHADGGIALAFVAAETKRIGLLSGISLHHEHPFSAARRIAALDRLSSGRAGMILEAVHFGADGQPEEGRADEGRVDEGRAEEYLDLARKLWDGWADDAFIADKARGVLIAEGHVRHANHRGGWYQVRGPLPLARAPQGHPVVAAIGERRVPGADLWLADPASAGAGPAGVDVLARIRLDDPADPLAGGLDPAALAGRLRGLAEAGRLHGISIAWPGVSALRRFLHETAPRLGLAAGAGGTLREQLGLSRPGLSVIDFGDSELFRGLSA